MEMKRRIALMLALLMTLMSLFAFAEEGTEDAILAYIGEEPVYQSAVDEIYNEIVSYYSQYGVDMSNEEMVSAARQMAMDTYLQTAFYDAKAVELGLDPLSEEDAFALMDSINNVYEDLINQVYSYYGLQPAEDATDEEKEEARKNAIAILDSMGYTYDYIAINERRNFLYEKVNTELTKDLSVSEDEIITKYNEHVASDEATYGNDPSMYESYTAYYGYEPYYVPEGFRGITHILIKSVDQDVLKTYHDLQNRFEEQAEPSETVAPQAETDTAEDTDAAAQSETAEEPEATEEPETPVTEAELEAARAAVIASVQDKIDEIYKKIDEGTPWPELVEEYSEDPGMKQEPNKTNGYSVFSDSMMYDPAFVQAAFSIDHIGDVSEPYVGMYGIYIVHYTRDVPSGPVPLNDELREQIENEILSGVRQDKIDEAYDAWKAQTQIDYTEAGLPYQPAAAEGADETVPAETADEAVPAETADETVPAESTEETVPAGTEE